MECRRADARWLRAGVMDRSGVERESVRKLLDCLPSCESRRAQFSHLKSISQHVTSMSRARTIVGMKIASSMCVA